MTTKTTTKKHHVKKTPLEPQNIGQNNTTAPLSVKKEGRGKLCTTSSITYIRIITTTTTHPCT